MVVIVRMLVEHAGPQSSSIHVDRERGLRIPVAMVELSIAEIAESPSSVNRQRIEGVLVVPIADKYLLLPIMAQFTA